MQAAGDPTSQIRSDDYVMHYGDQVSAAPAPPVQAAPVEEPELAIDPEVQKCIDRDGSKMLAERCLKRYHIYKDWREKNIEPIWTAITKAYEGYTQADPAPYRHQYVIREIFRFMDVLRALVSEEFFSTEQNFRYRPRHSGYQEKADTATAIVQDQLGRFDLQDELQTWLDAAPYFGVSYIQYGWQNYRRFEHKAESVYCEDGTRWWDKETTDREESAPLLRFLNPWGLYTHPFIDRVAKSPYVYYREIVSADYIKTLVREGVADAKACKAAGMDCEDLSASGKAAEIMDGRDVAGEYDVNLDVEDDPVEMITAWTNDGWEYIILNGEYVIRARKNKFGKVPVVDLRNYPMPGKHYGYPDPLIVLDDQKYLNDIMGMHVDALHYSGAPMFVMPTEMKKEFGHVVWRPGGAIYTDSPEKVQQFTVAPLQAQLAQDAGFVLSNMRRSTGITDEISGTGSEQSTATGLVRLQNAASTKIKRKVRLYMPAFRKVYGVLFELNAAFLDDEYALRLEGEDGQAVYKAGSPDDFSVPMDVEVELGNQMESGPEAANKWQTAYKLFGMDPLMDRAYILEKNIQALGERHPKRAMVNPALAQSDALDENKAIMAYGIVPDPRPQDNHQVHLQIHAMFMQSPEFQSMAVQRPQWAMVLQQHMAKHNEYFQAMQMANAQAQQAATNPAGPGASGVGPEANGRANAMFNMGQRGREQMGAQ